MERMFNFRILAKIARIRKLNAPDIGKISRTRKLNIPDIDKIAKNWDPKSRMGIVANGQS